MTPGNAVPSGGYTLRAAVPADAAIVALQRARMFCDMGSVSPAESEILREASEPWLADHLRRGSYLGWLVEYRGVVVAGGGIHLREVGPMPGCLRVGRWANIANVYTHPDHRRRGLARWLMQAVLEWCASNGMDLVTLSPSEEARPLYESLGFSATRDMRLMK